MIRKNFTCGKKKNLRPGTDQGSGWISSPLDIYNFFLFIGVNPDGLLQPPATLRQNIPHFLYFAKIICLYAYYKKAEFLSNDWISLFESNSPGQTISELKF